MPPSAVEAALLENLKHYLAFTTDSSAVLRELHPLATPHFPQIVDDFYTTIEAHASARGAIRGGAAQITRLKETLRRWLETTLLGPNDESYFEARARIGRVHVRIDLPPARSRLCSVTLSREIPWCPSIDAHP
jgi:hypothetical protein